jgi:carbon monoxide dehydrogenase subunit G
MRSSYDAVVAGSVDAVWASLTDVDSVLAALPGAALARDDAGVSGSLKCKLGSTQITYRLTARAEVGEAGFHSAVIAVTGKEARGSGTLAATLTMSLRDEGGQTRVEVGGDIEASGRGEAADERAWARMLESLVKALIPPPAASPVPPPARPPLTVAPPLPEPRSVAATQADAQRRLLFGLGAAVLFLLIRRLRRRRHG